MALDEYYILGGSSLRVSRLALGTMTFGTEWGWGCDEATARALFGAYLDAGGNFIDTADTYTNGTSERLLGQFIAERKARDRVVLATKFTHNGAPGNPNAGGNGRKNVMRALNASLERLRTDYIDLYFLHTWDLLTRPDEAMRTFDDLVRSGKVRHVALSDVPAWYAARAQTLAEWRGYEPVCALQVEYSLVERNIEHEFTRLATDYGMGLMVWSPLGGGVLSGKYRPAENGSTGAGRLQVTKGFSKLTEHNFRIVAELEGVAREVERSMAQVAINWVAHRPGVASVILGATKLAQLEDTMRALDFELPAPLAARLESVSRPEARFPYSFFGGRLQQSIHGGVTVGDEPPGYRAPLVVPALKRS